MRWFWVDRFVEFESGKRAVSVKNVSLSEEHMHDHFPSYPIMPTSLMLEGMAQTGGILLGEHSNFEHFVVLAKVPKAQFHEYVLPGETIRYTAQILDFQDAGGVVECKAHVEDRLVAESEIIFAYLDASQSSFGESLDQKDIIHMMGGLLEIMEVGKGQ